MNMLVSHWSANPLVLAVYLVVAGAHLLGMRTPASRRHAVREAAWFHAGLLVVLAALLSPVGYWAQHDMWVRSIQDLLLANVAAALIVLGAPWQPLRRGLMLDRLGAGRLGAGRLGAGRLGAGRLGAGRLRASRLWPSGGRRPGTRWPRLPVLVVVLFNVVWCGWHVPALYDAALTHPAVYAAEIVSYLALGVLFWLQLIGSWPASPILAPLRRVVVLTGTVVVGTVLGMILVFGSTIVYTGYLTAHHVGYAVLADQQAAGAVLWVLMLPSYTIACVALLVRWLNDEEAQAFESGLDRLLKPAKSAWPSRPGPR
jgi:cytochrome c oxidase assembly factor CtaG